MVDGIEGAVASLLALVVFWTGLFYLLVFTESRWAGSVAPSSKPHENNCYWAARNLIGGIHAVFVVAITVPAFFVLCGCPDTIRFGSTEHLATCRASAEQIQDFGAKVNYLCQSVAFAGIAFTAFTTADVIISVVHGLATWDYVVHHVAFISAGFVIRGHCMLPYNAAILLAMEASTPFLNYMLFFRHRGEAYSTSVGICGVLFVALYVIFRLVLNTYGAVLLWLRRASAMPPTVPEWQVWFLLVAVTAGAAVQIFWFPGIAKTCVKRVMELTHTEEEQKCDSSTSAGDVSLSSSDDSSEEDERPFVAEGREVR